LQRGAAAGEDFDDLGIEFRQRIGVSGRRILVLHQVFLGIRRPYSPSQALARHRIIWDI
jgi:hypothetical protein